MISVNRMLVYSELYALRGYKYLDNCCICFTDLNNVSFLTHYYVVCTESEINYYYITYHVSSLAIVLQQNLRDWVIYSIIQYTCT